MSADEVKKVASEVQKSPPQVALAWLLSRSTVTSVLLGASKLEQLENNLGSLQSRAVRCDFRVRVIEAARNELVASVFVILAG